MQHVNFYENTKEADIRLKDTVVLYDGKPYYVLCITDHKKDGVFRIYLDDLSRLDGPCHHRLSVPYEWHDEPNKTRGDVMDDFIEKNPDAGIIRKMMNSSLFNKYRPFPLGMVNHSGSVVYAERTPTRYTQQGLISAMVGFHEPDVTGREGGGAIIRKSQVPNILSFQFSQMLTNQYPRPDECIANLNDPAVANRAIGFHRNFAFVRGPIGLLFLAYKQDIVGYMPHGDLSRVTLANKFRHTKEVVDNLKLFDDIKVVSA